MNLQSQLLAARDSLSPSNWRKGHYFRTENNILCMCAHGALQAQVNPVCKSKIDNSKSAPADAAVVTAVVAAVVAVVTSAVVGEDPSLSLKEIWDKRSEYVKNDRIYDSLNYGNGEAHYLLGMVGLTTTFNDAKDTTFEMLIAKFDEAIALANQLGV